MHTLILNVTTSWWFWSIITFLALLVFLFLIKGPGRPVELLDSTGESYENGISVRESINIGGSKQYAFMVGENVENPVLLFLHGGPGAPEISMFDFEEGNRLESRFTVCYWEQRGAGLSYGARVSKDDMSVNLMIEDTIEMTEYLMKRFNKQKIYLMGHSWGSYLGIKTIDRKPEYYHAYFGIGQVSNQHQSEVLGYHFLNNYAKKHNDSKAINELAKFDVENSNFPTQKYIMTARSTLMNKYGVGIIHELDYKMSAFIKKIMSFRGYSTLNLITFLLGSKFSSDTLFKYVLADSLVTITDFHVPIIFLNGAHDYQVSEKLARQYFDNITAPMKQYHVFNNSAHSPMIEESTLFLTTVFDILNNIEHHQKNSH